MGGGGGANHAAHTGGRTGNLPTINHAATPTIPEAATIGARSPRNEEHQRPRQSTHLPTMHLENGADDEPLQTKQRTKRQPPRRANV